MDRDEPVGDSERDARLRLLLDSVHDYAIFMLDPQGRVQSWNTGAERLKGYRAEQIVGSHFSRFYTEDAVARGWPQHELEMAAVTGRFEDEGWRVRQDGSQFWANVVISAMRDASGALVGFSKVTRDLTERRQAEERVRQSEERFRLLVDSVRDYAIFMLAPDGVVMSWNAGAERMKGYRPDEIIGRHFSVFYPEDARARGWPEHELTVARTEGRVEHEGWRLRQDGSRFWAHVVISALHDEQGVLRGFSKVTRDLTERRKLEELEAAGRRTAEFLAMLGHELRNPLAPILNAAELLHGCDDADPRLARARELLDRQTAHLTRIVDDLLDVGRITTGKITLRREPLDLVAAVTEAVDAARPLMTERGHQLALQVSPGDLTVDGDVVRLAQVVSNLLTNAARYTPPGGHVTVALARDDHHALLRVSDDGVGMPPELITRVFDLFVQGERALDRAEGGLGVGLTLVRQVVELHGGTVSASSRGPGLGSTLLVRLPLLEARTAAPAPVVEPARAPPRLPRVLVVDDNEDSADSMAMLLEMWGHEVSVAHDGLAALAAIAERGPDVVLLDIGMPGMDGYTVAERVREAGGGPVLVAMTGYGQADDIARGRAAGFAEHLVKPVAAARLKALLATLPSR